MERDKDGLNGANGMNDFNSHAHVERDVEKVFLLAFALDFNSHAHVERDYDVQNACYQLLISTHTLTWSVTHGISVLFFFV